MNHQMTLQPPPSGRCPVCACKHAPYQPHNASSLYYVLRFHATHGRPVTWADAVAHCPALIRDAYCRHLKSAGKWTQPATDEAIADPPAESTQTCVEIGDVIVGFGGRCGSVWHHAPGYLGPVCHECGERAGRRQWEP
tara:strand:+ start:656 stop:1069 length:414 start_codon:yes stop_codon:yes gene_type:complete